MPRKKMIKKRDVNGQQARWVKINPNAAGLTLGILSVIISLFVVVGAIFMGLDDVGGGISVKNPSGAIMFIISAFIEGSLVGLIAAWLYNRLARLY